RIEPRRFACGIETEEDADRRGYAERDADRPRADHDRPVEQLAGERRRADAEGGAEDAADDRERDRFEEELQQHVTSLRADGHANADLSRPFRYRVEHDVHDADAADEYRHRGDRQ